MLANVKLLKRIIQTCLLILPMLALANEPINAIDTKSEIKKIISAPITEFHKARLGTNIFVGKGNTGDKKAFVEIDTGSSRLMLEKQYLTNYQATNKKVSIKYGYKSLSSKHTGTLVYSDITFDTEPKITAKHVPIIMVPDGTFKGYAGILGLKLTTQNSPWNYLPSPYNQVMIINGPKHTLSFGPSSKKTLDKYTLYKIHSTAQCHNTVIPRYPINQIKCWDAYVPVKYTIINDDGKIIFDKTLPTLFDSGGYYTHLLLPKLPEKLKQHTKDGLLINGKIKSALFTKNKSNIPTTSEVRVSEQNKSEVNSGHQLFYDKSVLFDSANGFIGIK